jgi:hypothetical protein
MSEDKLRVPAEEAPPEAGLASQIRRLRSAAGLSEAGLANLVGYSREYASRAERPTKGLASAELIRVIDSALHADGALIAHRARFRLQVLAAVVLAGRERAGARGAGPGSTTRW